jgi:hypothetical protein
MLLLLRPAGRALRGSLIAGLMANRGRDCMKTASGRLTLGAVPCRRTLAELAEVGRLLEVPLLLEAEVAVACSFPVLESIGPLGVPSV